MAKEKEQQGLSFAPDDMAEGGGLLDNIRATITGGAFEVTNYGGKAKQKVFAARLDLEEQNGTAHEDQWWKMGDVEDWVAINGGRGFDRAGVKDAVNKGTNFGIFMNSLIDAGFPADKLTPDIGCLFGLEAHFQQQIVEGRDKIKSKDGSKEYDPKVLCVAEIFSFPWEKKSKAKTGGGKKSSAKGKGTTESNGADTGVEDATAQIITEILLEVAEQSEDGTVEIPKKSLGTSIMKKAKANDDIDPKMTNQMVKKAFEDEFLGAQDRPWTYEDGVLSM